MQFRLKQSTWAVVMSYDKLPWQRDILKVNMRSWRSAAWTGKSNDGRSSNQRGTNVKYLFPAEQKQVMWTTFWRRYMLTSCWFNVHDAGPTLKRHRAIVSCSLKVKPWNVITDDGPALIQHRENVSDDGPALNRHWIGVSCVPSHCNAHDRLTQCWFTVGPSSSTLGQH